MTNTGRPRQTERGAKLLAVGEIEPPGDGGDETDEIVFFGFADVTAGVLDEMQPDLVLSPLVGQGFDCCDLAHLLVAAGYRGKYRAVAPPVPNPDLVRREIAETFPDLDFDLIVLDGQHD